MTKDLALSLLRSGTNGAQILQILESIGDGDAGSESAPAAGEPTASAIDF
jgi:hypothetical protein